MSGFSLRCLGCVSVLILLTQASAAEPKISFTRQIKPILANRCFVCHGPDRMENAAELRLDLRDEAVPAAIKPGDAEHSEVMVRITSTDPEIKMPPATSKKPGMTEGEIALVRQWIDQGAEYDAHWSYVKPQRPAVPAVKAAAWPASPIDNFVLAKLEEKGIAPAAATDRRTLLRRLCFDLIGLPPTPEEMDEFEADKSDQAYEKVVDRLLASKHFGERMAVYWLDVVRYADTAGYHSDNHRDVWPCIAITSSRRSTRTSRSTSSRSSNWPATCCPARRTSSGSRRATTACCRRPKRAAPSPRSTPPNTPPTACGTRR